jgi:membrane protein YdbS with pleckstrin-like domain
VSAPGETRSAERRSVWATIAPERALLSAFVSLLVWLFALATGEAWWSTVVGLLLLAAAAAQLVAAVRLRR